MSARLAALALLAAALLALAACRVQIGYPHACDGHGGISWQLKGIYHCGDGSRIGSGWLWLHPDDPRARP